MRRAAAILFLCAGTVAAVAAPVPPREERGRAGAECRVGETGPAIRVALSGLKDRSGLIQLDLYPANDRDFLAPDRVLIADDKPFRRVVAAAPSAGPVHLCIRAPFPGRWAIAILHDRDRDGRFGFLRDGVGFPGNPRLGRSKPRVDQVALDVGGGVASAAIVMNYRRGLGFGPLD